MTRVTSVGSRQSAVRVSPGSRIAVAALLAIVLATTLPSSRIGAEAPLGTADSRLPTAGVTALKGISSGASGAFSIVRIEATDPVAYVTSHPDALTVLVDLRNVRAAASADAGTSSGRPVTPIGGVGVETTTESDGTPVLRVRISLTRAATHRVRSSRNLIFVEVERTATVQDGKTPVNASRALLHTAADHLVQQPPPPPALSERALPSRESNGPPVPIQEPIAQPANPAPLQSPAPGEPRRFTGHPVSLDFQGADLRSVLRTFAEISGLNIVLDGGIPACGASGAGCVDLALKDVPWDQALDIILRSNKLGYAVDGTIVRIAPMSVLADEEGDRRKLADAQALAGELQVLTRALSYAKAQDLVPILTRSALSQRGDVQVDQRTNTLVIRDLQDRLTTAEELIETLDKPERQVEIEARIVRVRRNYARELGVMWGVNGRMSPDLGNTTNLAFPNSGSISGRTGGTQGPQGDGTAVNVPTENAPTGAIGLALGAVNGAFQLDVELQALEDQGKLRLLSSPRVSTQNNVQAEITQGKQIPYQTTANNTTTVSFKDAALSLKVTPQITASETVILTINLEKSAADFSQSSSNPPIDTQRAITNVLLADGETTVIGGIFESENVTSQASVPLLSRVPLLGWLFKNNVQSEFQDELMIFITPRILR